MLLRAFPTAAVRVCSAALAVVVASASTGSAASRTQVEATVVVVPAPVPVPVVPVVPVVPAGTPSDSANALPGDSSPLNAASTTITTTTTTTIAKNRVLVLKGKGFGHGRGLGQWGAFGYARDLGWNYRRILDHYYGGTVAGQVSARSAVGVRLSALDTKALIVFQPKGRLYTGPEGQAGFTMPPGLAAAQPAVVTDLNAPAPAPGTPIPIVAAGPVPAGPVPASGAVGAAGSGAAADGSTGLVPPLLTAGPASIKIELVKGGFRISDGPSCTGPWSVRPGLLAVNAITLTAGPPDPLVSPDEPQEMLQICAGKQRKVYRGDLLAVDAKPGQRTVNIVGLEAYLRGVVPREIAASWGDKAPEAVKAQAVAARSYAAAEKRSGFSNTCDTISCQVYNGRGVVEANNKFTSYEDPRTDRAVAETANEVRVNPKSGAPIRTEFSASTGGHTAPGDFPPVPDRGDAVKENPNSSWTVRLAASRLETKGLGALIGAKVTKRDGFGDDGGRVIEMELRYTGGTRKVGGRDVMSTYKLRSNWFDASVVAEGTETPLDTSGTADANTALTGDAVVVAGVTVAPEASDANSTGSAAKAKKTTTASKAKKTKVATQPATVTTIAVIVAAAGTPVNTVVGGAAPGAPTTVAAKKKTTKKRR